MKALLEDFDNSDTIGQVEEQEAEPFSCFDKHEPVARDALLARGWLELPYFLPDSQSWKAKAEQQHLLACDWWVSRDRFRESYVIDLLAIEARIGTYLASPHHIAAAIGVIEQAREALPYYYETPFHPPTAGELTEWRMAHRPNHYDRSAWDEALSATDKGAFLCALGKLADWGAVAEGVCVVMARTLRSYQHPRFYTDIGAIEVGIKRASVEYNLSPFLPGVNRVKVHL